MTNFIYTHTTYNVTPTPQFVKEHFSRGGYDGRAVHHSNYIGIPKEKVYAVLDGDPVLRAVKIEKVFYSHSGNCLVYGKVAGVGYRIFKYWGYVYDSKEDYLAKNDTSMFKEHIPYFDKIKSYGGEVVPRNKCESYLVKWGWIDNQPKCINCDFIVEYDVPTKAIKVHFLNVDSRYKYNTKEECIADNEVAVCDFDEPTAPKKEVCVDVTTSFHFSSNLTIEEIKAKVRESFGGKDYRCFINQELVIDDC